MCTLSPNTVGLHLQITDAYFFSFFKNNDPKTVIDIKNERMGLIVYNQYNVLKKITTAGTHKKRTLNQAFSRL